jgi:3-hydroxyisobutyrate dehydrogenase-like beta-hydroxyacid dehydrogenase
MPEMGDRLGWLGTGRMGAAMGERLLDSGAPLVVWNRSPEKTALLAGRGAKVAGSIAELAATSDVVFTMVTGSGDMLEVVAGLLGADTRPAVIVDCSTTSEEASAQAREACTVHGVAFVAAPVSGDPAMVRNGAAAIVCSGPDDAFARVQPVLDQIAPTVVYAGPGEQARLAKLCSNLILGVFGQAMVEVAALAALGGIDPAKFAEFLNGSVVGSTYVRHKGRSVAAGTPMPAPARAALQRDFDTSLRAAGDLDQPMPLSALVRQLL